MNRENVKEKNAHAEVVVVVVITVLEQFGIVI